MNVEDRWRVVPSAAALLFCVGAGWVGLSTPAGKGKRETESFLFRVVHEGTANCRPADACRNDGHWTAFAGGRPLERPTLVDGLLPKDRPVVVDGPPITPWGFVRVVQRACVKAGIQEVHWRIGTQELKVRVKPPRKPSLFEPLRLEEITVLLKVDPTGEGTVRRVGNRKTVDSDEDLIRVILQMMADYKKAGKTEFPIFIHAAVDVSWREVVRVIELCRKEGLHDLSVEVPGPEPIPEVPRIPDKRLFGLPEDK